MLKPPEMLCFRRFFFLKSPQTILPVGFLIGISKQQNFLLTNIVQNARIILNRFEIDGRNKQ
jgi:hypothetical protein